MLRAKITILGIAFAVIVVIILCTPMRTQIDIQHEQNIERLRQLALKQEEELRLITDYMLKDKAEWQSKFEKTYTRDRVFRLSAGKNIEVPTMHKKIYAGYAQKKGLQILQMSYKGDRMSMVVVLPEKVDGLNALERSLTPKRVQRLLADIQKQEVDVFLPKFKFTTGISLKKPLHAAGMVDAFSRRTADFSGMNGIKPPADGCMYIQDALHKAFVAVDEEGTEAAAATAVLMGAAGGMPPPAPVFKADHPFLLFIRDKTSGVIVFLGRVMNPK